jgi:hypothetical protein
MSQTITRKFTAGTDIKAGMLCRLGEDGKMYPASMSGFPKIEIEDDEDPLYPPCTCPPECRDEDEDDTDYTDCKGECGCERHMALYTDALSAEYDMDY